MSNQLPRRPLTLADLLGNLVPWTVGFDRQFSAFEPMLTERVGFPPYNIRRTAENSYRIEMAVAGFTRDELVVTVEERTLRINGAKTETDNDGYLHRGIAGRNFSHRIGLAEYVEVRDAALTDGILSIDLERVVPEEKQPREITIG